MTPVVQGQEVTIVLPENEATATADAFQAALRAWERAALDGLAALASVPPAERVAHA